MNHAISIQLQDKSLLSHNASSLCIGFGRNSSGLIWLTYRLFDVLIESQCDKGDGRKDFEGATKRIHNTRASKNKEEKLRQS